MASFSHSRRKLFVTASQLALASSLVSSGLASSSEQRKDKYGIRGQKAPEISLDYWVDGSGNRASFSMEASKGKWIFLKFFQNWCPGCHSSGFPTLKAVCDEFYGHPKVEIAAVQTVFEGEWTNTQDAVRELQLQYEIPAIMGHDPGDMKNGIPALTMVNYRSGGTPWLVLVNPEGVVVFNDYHADPERLIQFLHSQIS